MIKKLILLTLICALPLAVNARVRLITDVEDASSKGTSSDGNDSYAISDYAKCGGKGYRKTSCESGMYINSKCPDNSMYVKCCPEEYTFKKDDCLNLNGTPSKYSCGGLYGCFIPTAPAAPAAQ